MEPTLTDFLHFCNKHGVRLKAIQRLETKWLICGFHNKTYICASHENLKLAMLLLVLNRYHKELRS